jgi:hypothetical protein
MTSSDYNFNRLFVETKGGPVIFNGRTLILADKIPAKLGDVLTVTIESTSSPHPQGVGISDGVEVFGERVRRAVVWEYFSLPPEERTQARSNLPFSFQITCRNKSGHLSFYNMAEVHGRQEWWHHASCMIAEDILGGRRYRCNDFEPDADFDDIIFRVERHII